jgi:hypothetical protein
MEHQAAVFKWMMIVLALQILLFGITLMFTSEGNKFIPDFFIGVWDAWTLISDPGTQASVEGTSRKIVAMANSLIGIFYFAVIQALIVDMVRERMDSIKKGKGFIVERDHILVLGM